MTTGDERKRLVVVGNAPIGRSEARVLVYGAVEPSTRLYLRPTGQLVLIIRPSMIMEHQPPVYTQPKPKRPKRPRQPKKPVQKRHNKGR